MNVVCCLFCAALLCFFGVVPVAGLAQESASSIGQPTTLLTEGEAKDFSQALPALASRAKVAIVAEATPFQPTLTELPPDMPQGDVETLLPWLARAYDYTAEQQGNVWILRKKYTEAGDVPAVTLAECRKTLDDVSRLIARYHPASKVYVTPTRVYFGEDQIYRKFWLSLSSEQRQRMRGLYQGDYIVSTASKENVLPVDDLGATQKKWLWQAAVGWYVQGAQNSILNTLEEMENISSNGAAFLYYKPREDNNWGYESRSVFPGAFPNSTLFWAIDGSNLPGGMLFRNRRFPPAMRSSRRPAPIPKGTMPVFKLPAWATQAKPAPPITGEPIVWKEGADPVPTLGSIAAEMNRQAGASAPHYVVDATIAGKPVTLAGQENASPETVFRALSKLYDLHIVYLPNQPMRLMPRALPEGRTLGDVSRLTWAQFPAPLRRALRIESTDPKTEMKRFEEDQKEFLKLFGVSKDRPPTQGLLSMMEGRKDEIPFIEAKAVGVAMSKFLRQTLKPRVDATPDETILVSQLRPQEEAAFAAYFMAITYRDCGEFVKSEYPRYLAEFDSCYVSGKLGVGRPDAYSLTLAALMPDGERVYNCSPTYGGSIEPEYTGPP